MYSKKQFDQGTILGLPTLLPINSLFEIVNKIIF